MISEPVPLPNGMWIVKTSKGIKIFSDEETAEDFYLLNKGRLQSVPIDPNPQHGQPPNP